MNFMQYVKQNDVMFVTYFCIKTNVLYLYVRSVLLNWRKWKTNIFLRILLKMKMVKEQQQNDHWCNFSFLLVLPVAQCILEFIGEEDLCYNNKVRSFSNILSEIYLITNLLIDFLIYFIVNAIKQSSFIYSFMCFFILFFIH